MITAITVIVTLLMLFGGVICAAAELIPPYTTKARVITWFFIGALVMGLICGIVFLLLSPL